ncbi:DUF2929 family protein [Virgibacillus sp. C22-A2]|uniref:DUF2929 family protein n=2 Tax=Virgibacillus tibetensis TaxID=3042313 RepID=A0ABU6KEV9_9BACI|nr:DUF2929 family protein [Virgibacillus sp. C22-A2]
MTIVWAVLISGVISYVLSSMGNEAFSLVNTLVLAAILVVAVVILGEGVLKEEDTN